MKSLNLISEELTKKILGKEELPYDDFFITEMRTIGIEKLPYSYSSIRRFIDPETMKFHYQKHYKGYVKKLNSALRKKDYGDVELEKIVKQISKYNTTIKNNAGGAFNHALFWKMLSPTPQKPSGPVIDAIKKSFGSYREFKERFESVAKKRFGSGWVWLVITKGGRLKVMSTPNQENPLMNIYDKGGFPILGLDLWEHAYYLKYQNKRDEYIQNFWDVINWKFVNELFLSKTKPEKEMIKESSESHKPLKKEYDFYKVIFSNHESLLKQYRFCVDGAMKSVFPNNWKGWNEYEKGSVPGLYNLWGVDGRHPLNKLNTNYVCFTILLNDINKALSKYGEKELDFIGLLPEEQKQEMDRFCEKLNQFKGRIFKKDSNTMQNILDTLGVKHDVGESLEKYVVSKINNKYGEDAAKVIGGLGVSSDFMGIDVVVNIKGKSLTAQVKTLINLKKKDNSYVVGISGIVREYKTDLLIFGNVGSKVYLFKNENVDASKSEFVIPKENLIITLD